MLERLRAHAPADCPLLALLDPRLLVSAVPWALGSLLAFGLVAAIIPNPIFGRQVPPAPFAYAVWIASAPLMGLVMATYTTRPRPTAGMAPILILDPALAGPAEERRGTWLGTIGSFGAFLAIGCPLCNKVALLLLGAGGAMSLYAPLQPLIGAASLAVLAGTLAWRLRLRARGGACAV